MNRRDLIYWLYKAEFPIERAAKNSGLESFFERQASVSWGLPLGFKTISELQLSAVGDLMDHPYLPNSAGFLYDDVSDTIFGADISMANLECVIYPQGSGSFAIRTTEAPPLYYNFASFSAAKGFQELKYTFMATANNHSLDCGEVGVESTIHTLRAEGIGFNGMNESEPNAYSATVVEKNGFRLGFVSYTFGLNAKKPPTEKPWIINRAHLNGKLREIDFDKFARQIQSCRQKKVDTVVAHLHWGLEHEYYPRPDQLEVAHHLAEMGFDIVIGHHPHLIQPMELYRTKRDPDRVVPIYYSLGNLVNPFSHPAFRHGGVARIKLAKGVSQNGSTCTYVKEADKVEVFQEIDEKHERIHLVQKRT
jgi:poly-gamma-glutamate synthesis protein (capsule biosynthesis protein)